jgi:hypothetical protein
MLLLLSFDTRVTRYSRELEHARSILSFKQTNFDGVFKVLGFKASISVHWSHVRLGCVYITRFLLCIYKDQNSFLW